ncbi:MAG TPA: MFS transporter [Actinokineospora sp.]|nr:MFS transporter [Actinokineospora sp.]
MSTLAAPPVTARRRPGRAERLLVPATFITCLGNNIQLTAAALLMLRAEQTTLAVGWLFVAVAAPQALLSAPFGRLADRFDRRRLLIICDVLSALGAAALPVWLLAGHPTGPGVYATNLLLAVVSALFLPASSALVKERVPADRLARFNANYEMANSAGMLLSTAAGGFLVQLFGAEPLFFLNAVTFLASAACWVGIGPRTPRPAASEDTRTMIAVGRSPVVRYGALYAVGNVVIVVSNTLIVVLVIQVFRQGPATLGLVDALAGVGMLLSAAVYRAAHSRIGDLRIALIGFVGVAFVIVLEPSIGIVGLLLFLPGGFTFGLARVASRTLLMSAVTEDRAGRVFGAANAVGLAASMVTTFAVSVISDQTEVRYGFYGLAALIVVVAVPVIATLSRVRPGDGGREAVATLTSAPWRERLGWVDPALRRNRE